MDPEKSLEQQRIIAAEEISKMLKTSQGFNNFGNQFRTKANPYYNYPRELTFETGNWGEKLSDFLAKNGQGPFSDLRWNQSFKDFFGAIDIAVEKALSSGEVDEFDVLIERRHSAAEPLEEEGFERLNELLKPIYIYLRLFGYNKNDLTD